MSEKPIFGREALQAAIDAELKAIPAGKNGCQVAIWGGNGWVEVRFAMRVHDQWQIGALVRRERGETKFGAQVLMTF